MENLYKQEKLNSIRNEMTHLWGTACATIGGAIALGLSPDATVYYYIIAAVGVLIGLVMINAYFIRRNEIIRVLSKTEE